MSQDMQGLVGETPKRIVLDVDALRDGSGNDRDPDESDTERFDAG